MKLTDAMSVIKSVPKTVWIAVVIPGGLIYIGAWAAKIIYKKTREHLTRNP